MRLLRAALASCHIIQRPGRCRARCPIHFIRRLAGHLAQDPAQPGAKGTRQHV